VKPLAVLLAVAVMAAFSVPELVQDGGHEGQALTTAWAAVLGALQGATEFLPVSSSGHLSLAQAWIGIDPASAGHRFNITVHAGTWFAVLWVYRQDVVKLLRAAARPTVGSVERTRLLMMLLASLPLVVVLLPPVEALVVAMESEVRLVGVALWVTAATLFFAFRNDRGATETPSNQPPRAWQALVIGCVQVFAVLPGISRSGSTIGAGLAVGLDRQAAARFSFLISLIAVGGASAKEVLAIVTSPESGVIDPAPYVVGFATSLVVGLFSLRGLLYLVGRGQVAGFVIYLVVMGAIAFALG
jgi:undecaprenyl-diphosphatase